MSTALNWIHATLLAAAILAGTIVGPDDLDAETATALSVADARAQAAIDMAHVRVLEAAHAAQAPTTEAEAYTTVTRVCKSLHAERALVLRTTDGDWVCRRINTPV